MTPRNLSSSSIKGTDVYNTADEKIGDIKDLMIDTRDGSVQYAVLSVGGFLGMGDRLFSVPVEAFDFDRKEGHNAILDVDKDRLKDAPGFDKDNWPSSANHEYLTNVYKHYGRTYRPRYDSATLVK